MNEIIVMTRDDSEHRIQYRDGETLMEAIRNAGIDELLAICGGSCSCATCHVHVNSDFWKFLPSATEEESDLLACSDACSEMSRLSCQIQLNARLSGMTVRIAAES